MFSIMLVQGQKRVVQKTIGIQESVSVEEQGIQEKITHLFGVLSILKNVR
jgi:hypothetical protein